MATEELDLGLAPTAEIKSYYLNPRPRRMEIMKWSVCTVLRPKQSSWMKTNGSSRSLLIRATAGSGWIVKWLNPISSDAAEASALFEHDGSPVPEPVRGGFERTASYPGPAASRISSKLRWRESPRPKSRPNFPLPGAFEAVTWLSRTPGRTGESRAEKDQTVSFQAGGRTQSCCCCP
ncbi:hypothetical protein BKA81DRAFT_93092 [Phyllosticta paracitricarpa]